MLIAWSVLNKARAPQDRRFSDAILVVCPNLTVKERLAVLHPADPSNYHEAFDLVPPGSAVPRSVGTGEGPTGQAREPGELSRDDRLLDEIEGALAMLASAWTREFGRWSDEGRPTPPAMIVVCDQTSTAERVADYLAEGG